MFYAEDIPSAVVSSFEFTPGTPGQNTTVQFTDTSTNTAANGTITYTWDFGDGSVLSSAKNPSHVYSSVGNFTVMHVARGSMNQTPSISYGVVSVQPVAAPLYCNSAGGNTAGVLLSYVSGETSTQQYERIWSGTWPNAVCRQPYTCTCDPYYAKYQCLPNGSETLISQNHPDCCALCNFNNAPVGTPPTVLNLPNFVVTSVSVTPSTTCYSGEYIQIVASVSNTGSVAAAATVTFYWDDGTAFDLERTTPVINVNSTQNTPPAGGYADRAGVICAVVKM
jgi:PKD repeat protein